MKVEDQELLRKFNEGWDKAHTTSGIKPPTDIGGGGGGNNEASNLMSNIQQNAASLMYSMNQPYSPPAIPTTGNTCDQCNLIHPPIRPGEVCPNATPKPKPVQAPPVPAKEPHMTQPLTEGTTKSEVKQVNDTPKHPIAPPPPPTRHAMAPASSGSAFEVKPEPEPLAENNIPTEIHVNKYLSVWGDMIQAHCTKHSIQNVKKLMRHLTVEITDFLEANKGK